MGHFGAVGIQCYSENSFELSREFNLCTKWYRIPIQMCSACIGACPGRPAHTGDRSSARARAPGGVLGHRPTSEGR
jgi:hypothetical protein